MHINLTAPTLIIPANFYMASHKDLPPALLTLSYSYIPGLVMMSLLSESEAKPRMSVNNKESTWDIP